VNGSLRLHELHREWLRCIDERQLGDLSGSRQAGEAGPTPRALRRVPLRISTTDVIELVIEQVENDAVEGFTVHGRRLLG